MDTQQAQTTDSHSALLGENKIHTHIMLPEHIKHTTPLIFVHMSWGCGALFVKFMQHFVKQGYACYALDLRGHGRSGGTVSGARMQDYVDDIRLVVENFHLSQPIIIGHGMGGLVSLMYGSQFETSRLVMLNSSPTLEVKQQRESKEYLDTYTPIDAGMPVDPGLMTQIFSDMSPSALVNIKELFKKESGFARTERKYGISVPVESLGGTPLLFIGAEYGSSVSFGVGLENVRAQAGYYGGDFFEILGATHVGLVAGRYAPQVMEKIGE